MHKKSKALTVKRRKFVSKRNYQYLGLLGISLCSLSLSQMKPVDAHADASSEQSTMVASQSSESSASSRVSDESSSNSEGTKHNYNVNSSNVNQKTKRHKLATQWSHRVMGTEPANRLIRPNKVSITA